MFFITPDTFNLKSSFRALISFEFTSVPVYVYLMTEQRVTLKKSCPDTGPFVFPHVLINNYSSKYRTEFSGCFENSKP